MKVLSLKEMTKCRMLVIIFVKENRFNNRFEIDN